MKKILILLAVFLIFLMMQLSRGGNTSSQELLLNESRARSNVDDIMTQLDVADELAHIGIDVSSTGFKGTIFQPPSSTESYLTTYRLRGDDLKINYKDGELEVTGTGSGFSDYAFAHLGLPTMTRNQLITSGHKEPIDMGTVYDRINPGIRPIIVSDDWIEDFFLEERGLAFSRLASNDSSFNAMVDKIESDADYRKELMAFIFGNTDSLDWNAFRSDRIVSMLHVNIDALTGLSTAPELQELTNPNLVSLYKVDHINTNMFSTLQSDSLYSKPTADGGFGGNAMMFNTFVVHLNQVLGNKLVLIPHQQASTLMIDGVPTFVLN